MPTNNFKLFDENKANMLSDTEFANSTQRLNGVQTGVASSQLNNKFAYQVSLVAYAIAQIMNQNNLDASDTLAVSAFVGNLGGALLQKVADKASSTEAAAGVLNNKYITPSTMKAAALLLSGGTMSGNINMNFSQITNLDDPTDKYDAANKWYVDHTKTTLETEIGKVSSKIMKETVEDVTHTFTTYTDRGPYILQNKDFKNTIAIKQKVVLNGTMQGSRSYNCTFILGTNSMLPSNYDTRTFEFFASYSSPTIFSNAVYEYTTSVNTCTIIGNDLSHVSNTTCGLTSPGVDRQIFYPALHIDTDNNLVTNSTGLTLRGNASTTDILNLTVHYIMERYYINF